MFLWLYIFVCHYGLMTEGHFVLTDPVPRQPDNFNPLPGNQRSIATTGFVCRGTTPGQVRTTITAGETRSITMKANAANHCGDCSAYISYDVTKPEADQEYFHIAEAKDYIVPGVKLGPADVTFPKWLPAAEHAIFRWQCFTLHQGPPEYYANCADIKIENADASKTALPPTFKIPGHMPTEGYGTCTATVHGLGPPIATEPLNSGTPSDPGNTNPPTPNSNVLTCKDFQCPTYKQLIASPESKICLRQPTTPDSNSPVTTPAPTPGAAGPCAGVPAYSATETYATPGTCVTYQGKKYCNRWYLNPGQTTPGTGDGGPGDPWEPKESCSRRRSLLSIPGRRLLAKWDGLFSQFVGNNKFCTNGGDGSFTCGGGGTAGQFMCSTDACPTQFAFCGNEVAITATQSQINGASPYRVFTNVYPDKGLLNGAFSFFLTFKTEGFKDLGAYNKFWFWTDNGNILGLLPPGHSRNTGTKTLLIAGAQDDFPNQWGNEMTIDDDTWYRVQLNFDATGSNLEIIINGITFVPSGPWGSKPQATLGMQLGFYTYNYGGKPTVEKGTIRIRNVCASDNPTECATETIVPGCASDGQVDMGATPSPTPPPGQGTTPNTDVGCLESECCSASPYTWDSDGMTQETACAGRTGTCGLPAMKVTQNVWCVGPDGQKYPENYCEAPLNVAVSFVCPETPPCAGGCGTQNGAVCNPGVCQKLVACQENQDGTSSCNYETDVGGSCGNGVSDTCKPDGTCFYCNADMCGRCKDDVKYGTACLDDSGVGVHFRALLMNTLLMSLISLALL